MATETAKRDFAPILNAVQQWIKTCLIGGGSIFSTEKLWSSQYIGELKAAFIDHPDVGKDSFRTKLKGQLQNASPQAKHLAAEMLWAILAFPTNINQSTKRDQIREVWSFSGALLPDNHPMLNKEVLAGIGSGGTAYNNLRDRELAFLIHVAADLYQRTPSERERLLSNYDAFLEWITPLAKGENRQFRHMLRYFAFPDRVERMSSNRERQGFRVMESCSGGTPSCSGRAGSSLWFFTGSGRAPRLGRAGLDLALDRRQYPGWSARH
jgi:5-methylcytosine-specific restriction enzyme B